MRDLYIRNTKGAGLHEHVFSRSLSTLESPVDEQHSRIIGLKIPDQLHSLCMLFFHY